jgi:acetylserotonin O-methyltransferase
MAEDMTIPDPTVVLDLLTSFRESKAMFAAVSLGVFDALADGPQSAAALAGTIGANVASLERLLDACVGLQLLSRSPAGRERRGEFVCEHSSGDGLPHKE